MKKIALTMTVALAATCCFGFDYVKDAAKNSLPYEPKMQEFKLPNGIDENGVIDEKILGDSPFAKTVIFGSKLVNETSRYLGPNAKDEKKRFAGNNYSCSSCHTYGGVVPNHSPFVGIYARFPQYNSRADQVVTLQDRINGCFQHSMAGKPIPNNSKEMRAMVTYMQWLSTGYGVGDRVKGQGILKAELLDRAADPVKGKEIYAQKCASCHGENGEGVVNAEFEKGGDYYLFPSLWEKDSYNTGAGMYRLIKAAEYIKSTMPKGDETLSWEDSFDVAAYINSHERPIKSDREKDFPDLDIKPMDMDVAPYNDGFDEKTHRFGPYQQMIKR
ncbi:c-type cytochrome [Campylobacter suis]|uniref:Cytochrome c domain-containing protein n=1 Tax=Campylobacter suis TaxID=2790657 RepID=A0ABM8Q157_9BACT|nr:c-type cytochrome [Campylobacter suis]CAD7286524.1 hypothetical protein LMG8286_00357 [Campylobacter suis]